MMLAILGRLHHTPTGVKRLGVRDTSPLCMPSFYLFLGLFFVREACCLSLADLNARSSSLSRLNAAIAGMIDHAWLCWCLKGPLSSGHSDDCL